MPYKTLSVIRSPVTVLAMLALCECVELFCIAHTYILHYLNVFFIKQFKYYFIVVVITVFFVLNHRLYRFIINNFEHADALAGKCNIGFVKVTESYQNEPDTLCSSLPSHVQKLCNINEMYWVIVLAETCTKGYIINVNSLSPNTWNFRTNSVYQPESNFIICNLICKWIQKIPD